MTEKVLFEGHGLPVLGQPVAGERVASVYPAAAGVAGVTADTWIVTTKGLRPIADLQVGDEVLTHKGRYRPVTALRQRDYQGEMLSLQRARNNTPLTLTPHQPVLAVHAEICPHKSGMKRCLPTMCYYHLKGHRLNCPHYRDKYEQEWLAAGALRQGDWAYFPPTTAEVPTTLDIPFDPQSRHGKHANLIPTSVAVTPQLMAWLGYFIAEGTLANSTLHFSHTDMAEIKRVIWLGRILFGLNGTVHRTESQNHSFLLRFSSRPLMQWMISLLGQGRTEKRLPEWVFGLDEACRQALLSAILRSDGSYSHTERNGYAYHFTTASTTLAHQMMRLLLKEGVPCGLNTYQPGTFRSRGNKDSRYPDNRVDVLNVEYMHRLMVPPGAVPTEPPPETTSYIHDNYPFADSWLYTIKEIERRQVTTTAYALEVAQDHSYVTMAFALRQGDREIMNYEL